MQWERVVLPAFLTERAARSVLRDLYLGIQGSDYNAQLLAAKEPWEIDRNAVKGNNLTRRCFIECINWLDTARQFTLSDEIFRRQFQIPFRCAANYLVITGIENGILSIRYSTKEFRWNKSDENGDHYLRPKDAKNPGIESWSVHLPKDDLIRDILKNEMIRRKNLLVRAIESQNAAILPRLVEPMKSMRCPFCPFFDICQRVDGETQESVEMALEKDLLDISGVLDFKPVTET